jgi:hypothetical protein
MCRTPLYGLYAYYGGHGVICTCHLPWMQMAPMPQQDVPQNTPSGSHGSPCSNCPVQAVHPGGSQIHAGGDRGGTTYGTPLHGRSTRAGRYPHDTPSG